jgi:uncharacterized protein DUF930
MRRFALTLGLGLAVVATGAAAESHVKRKRKPMDPATAAERVERSLRMLAPNERLIQLCDYTAMQRIRQEAPDYKPDRAVADARSGIAINKDVVVAEGGAFRSRGKWYALTFTCAGSDDHMKVTSFSYKIGEEIPESKWTAFGLWE